MNARHPESCAGDPAPVRPKFRDSEGEVVFLRSGNLDAGEYEAGQLDVPAVIINGIASTVSFR